MHIIPGRVLIRGKVSVLLVVVLEPLMHGSHMIYEHNLALNFALRLALAAMPQEQTPLGKLGAVGMRRDDFRAHFQYCTAMQRA